MRLGIVYPDVAMLRLPHDPGLNLSLLLAFRIEVLPDAQHPNTPEAVD